jgi:hypothetical protein
MANRVRAAVIGWSFLRSPIGAGTATAYRPATTLIGPWAAASSAGRATAGDLALEDLLGLPHEVTHDGQLLRLEALGHLLHLLDDGLLGVLQPLLGRRHQLHPDPAAVIGVPSALHHAGRFEPVEQEGHGAGAQPALVGQLAGRHGAEAAEDVQAAHVGPAQLELLGHPLVEVAGRPEVPDDLRPQLLR